MSLIYRSESGKLEKYGYTIPGPFGIDYVAKFWLSDVEDRDFSYMLKWCEDNVAWEENNDGKMWTKYNCFTFDHPSIEKLKKNIYKEYLDFMDELGEEPEEIYINGWFNVFNINQGQGIHYHNFNESSYLSGVVVLTEGNTSTDFLTPARPEIVPNFNKPLHNLVKVNNFKGSLLFFPQWTYHFVDKLKDDITRVTIGFDIFTKNGMEKVKTEFEKDHMYNRAIKLSP